jgi:hypothetical protein
MHDIGLSHEGIKNVTPYPTAPIVTPGMGVTHPNTNQARQDVALFR